ncbi:sulfatase-like hydrolase/transferase [Carboxylicivirga sediminis]|uniref:Sulfatase-like hydrolase/transferase n=1 Tax=Carboxylicivirga sediminis TaxID=2006564 RepID=A0A941IXJ2_9BACT|nr:sulfatase-like hydrolase/transferase [Carboxylicivirga sediminis]MBR8536100.1 sulfatase-like hydrolase/transferase [Carboxylicivirga sediminis]
MNIMRKGYYLLFVILVFGFQHTTVNAQSPNVILIVSDDHGYADMNYLGVHDLKTPNLDQLAAESMSFTNAYVTSPICSPSRVGLITGQYQARNGNYFYGGSGIADGTKTIAQGFKDLGYVTGYFGKLHYGEDDSPASYNYPNNHGFDECVTAGHGGRVHYLYHNDEAMKHHGLPAEHWLRNGKELTEDGFSTEQISSWSQEFIEKNQKKPFFLQIAFNAVHNFTFQLPKKYLKEWNLPYYPDFEELDGSISRNVWYDQSIIPNLPHGRDYYHAQLHYMDREIGAIRKKLEELGLDDNTVIVYTTDNGGSNCSGGDNTPLYSTKYSLYEGGIRVPMLIHWENKIEKNTTNDIMVSTLDLMPTLLSAAGATEEAYTESDGLNLLPNILHEKEIERNTMVWDVEFAWAVRKGDWKLKVVLDQNIADKIAKKQHTNLGKGVELFNLAEDISEQNNVAESFPEIIEELTKIHEEWKKEVTQK